MRDKIILPKGWQELNSVLNPELKEFIVKRYEEKQTTPCFDDLFRSLSLTPLNDVKVVVLGQDPYPNSDFACGLAFSVSPTIVKLPMSLRNIYKESKSENLTGDLTSWAEQGVLLLNTSLTFSGLAHQRESMKMWQPFTDQIIRLVSDSAKSVVFMLWGAHAQSKSPLIDHQKHIVLQTSHPSPLSASRGFLGSDHFNEANKHLTPPITW